MPQLCRKWPLRCRRLRMANARLGRTIAGFTASIRKLDQRDAAEFTRTSLRDGRGAGPAELASLLRSVLKQGRRYKHPRVCPVLAIDGQLQADPLEVQTALEASFARLEQGELRGIYEIAQIMTPGSSVNAARLAGPARLG